MTHAILLMGPTASGKTDLAMALYDRLPVELISVDSALIYRGMDIGTAKPDAEVLERIPHHLIDLVDPGASFSVAEFQAAGRPIIPSAPVGHDGTAAWLESVAKTCNVSADMGLV